MRGCGTQSLPPEFVVCSVDGSSDVDQLINDLKTLVVGCHNKCTDSHLERCLGREPPGDVTDRCSLLEAMYTGPGLHEKVEDIGHAEYGRMQQRGSASHPTR